MERKIVNEREHPGLYLVKILSGVQLGAEAEYPIGRYRIGSDAKNDIVLADNDIEPHHAEIDLKETGFRLIEIDGTIETETGRVARDQALPFFTVFKLGSSSLVLGPRSGDWPDCQSIGIHDVQAAHLSMSTKAAMNEPSDQATAPHSSPNHGWAWKLVACAVILLLGSIAILTLTRVPESMVTQAEVGQEELENEEVFAILERYKDQSDLELSIDAGVFIVEGYVRNQATRRALIDDLANIESEIRTRLFVGDQLVETAGNTLNALGSNLSIDYVDHGRIRLAGYVEKEGDLQRIVDTLLRDVAGLNTIDNLVMTNTDVVDRLREQLADAGLAEGVNIRIQDDTIMAYGEIEKADVEAWRDIRRNFDQEFMPHFRLGSRVALRQSAEPGEETEAAGTPLSTEGSQPEFVIQGISIGPYPHIIDKDNRLHAEGSTIFGDWTIEKIELYQITLTRNGQQRVLVP